MNAITTILHLPLVSQTGHGDYKYVPFLMPLPAWGDTTWPWLLLPLCVAIAVVYKSIKCRTMTQVPREATILTLWIVAGMAVAAAALALIVEALERFAG